MILHLGGPEFCQGDFPSNDTFDEKSSPRVSITLCGVPPPVVEAEFLGVKLTVVNKTIDSYTHNYTLELPQLTKTACGEELTVTATVTATGYNRNLTEKMKIFLKNCKYHYYMFV